MEKFKPDIYLPLGIFTFIILETISPILAEKLNPRSTEVIVRPVDGAQFDAMLTREINDSKVEGIAQVQHTANQGCNSIVQQLRPQILNKLNQELRRIANVNNLKPPTIPQSTILDGRAIIGTQIAKRLNLESQIRGGGFWLQSMCV